MKKTYMLEFQDLKVIPLDFFLLLWTRFSATIFLRLTDAFLICEYCSYIWLFRTWNLSIFLVFVEIQVINLITLSFPMRLFTVIRIIHLFTLANRAANFLAKLSSREQFFVLCKSYSPSASVYARAPCPLIISEASEGLPNPSNLPKKERLSFLFPPTSKWMFADKKKVAHVC